MFDEASNILRRFIRVVEGLDPTELRYLKLSARTLHPFDLRQLAQEVYELAKPQRMIKYPPAGQPPVTTVSELRGLARSIITYGGPDAVRQDADPALLERLNRIGWDP